MNLSEIYVWFNLIYLTDYGTVITPECLQSQSKFYNTPHARQVHPTPGKVR